MSWSSAASELAPRLELAGVDVRGLRELRGRELWRYTPPGRVWASLTGNDGRPYPLLEYRRSETDGSFVPFENAAHPTGRALQEFIRLGELSDHALPAAVESFASRWGPLEICRHGMPAKHDASCWPLGSWVFASAPSLENLEPGTLRWEPLEAWRRYALQLRAILSVSADLRRGVVGDNADWRMIIEGGAPRRPIAERCDGWTGPTTYPLVRTLDGDWVATVPTDPVIHDAWGETGLDLDSQRGLVARAVDKWGQFGGISPRMNWWNGPLPELRLEYHGLAGVLAIELMATIMLPVAPARCVCGQVSGPEYKPRPDRRYWCGQTVRCDKRAQKRDYWDRKGAAAAKWKRLERTPASA